MDVRYINPFVESLIDTLTMMASIEPKAHKPYIKEDSFGTYDVTSSVNFSNDNTSGTVALSIDSNSALKIYALFAGEELAEFNNDVQDAIGEIVNMMAGGAKQKFSEDEIRFQISLPTVQLGKDSVIDHQEGCPIVVIPLDTDDINMCVEISMDISS